MCRQLKAQREKSTKELCLLHFVCILYCGCFNLFGDVWVCMCGCFYNSMGVLVIRVLVFTVFCIVCTVFFYCFVYVYLFLFVLSVLVQGLPPPSDNSTAVRVSR